MGSGQRDIHVLRLECYPTLFRVVQAPHHGVILGAPEEDQGQIGGVLRFKPLGAIKPGPELRRRVAGDCGDADRDLGRKREGVRAGMDLVEGPHAHGVVSGRRRDCSNRMFDVPERHQVHVAVSDTKANSGVADGRECFRDQLKGLPG